MNTAPSKFTARYLQVSRSAASTMSTNNAGATTVFEQFSSRGYLHQIMENLILGVFKLCRNKTPLEQYIIFESPLNLFFETTTNLIDGF
jgi:hypothetical protein